MPEIIQQPPQQSEFVRTFETMRTAVTNPDVSFVPFRDPLGPKLSTPLDHVPNYVVIQGKAKPTLKSGDPRHMYSYERWETSRPDLTEEFSSFRELPEADRRAWNTAPFLKGDSIQALYWLPAEWIPYVKSAGDVAHVLKYVFDQNIRFRERPHDVSFGRHVTQGAIALSLCYADRPDASVMTDAIHESLEAVEPEDREDFIRRIYSPIGKALLRSRVSAYSVVAHAVEELSGEELVRGVELYDQAGLISEKFWPSSGVVAKAAVRTPEFAPMLAAKLTGPDGERFVRREYLPYPSQAARAYITGVFSAYAEDPNRNRAYANRVLRVTAPDIKQGINIALPALIEEANSLADAFNHGIDQRGGDPSEKFAILGNELTFVSDAFLRLMGLTRHTDAPQTVQAAQWEQDIHHAEIIGAVLSPGSETAISDADVALRFPRLDQKQRTLVRRLMVGKGRKLLEALQEAQRRSPQDPSVEEQPGKE